MLILLSCNHPANTTLVCIMSHIKYDVILPSYLSICLGSDISATEPPVGVKLCMMVKLCPGQSFSPFGGDIFRGLQTRGQETERRHLTTSSSKTVSHSITCQSQLDGSFLKMVGITRQIHTGAPSLIIRPNMLHFCVFFQLWSFIIL